MGAISGFKEKILQKAVDVTLGKLDAWGSARWPLGWVKVKRARAGIEFTIGALVWYSPEIISFVTGSEFTALMEGAGLGAHTAGIIKLVGVVIAGARSLFKLLRLKQPLERRARSRVVTSDSGTMMILTPVAKAKSLPTPVTPAETGLTDLENEVYVREFGKRAITGMDFAEAREKALAVILKDRKTK